MYTIQKGDTNVTVTSVIKELPEDGDEIYGYTIKCSNGCYYSPFAYETEVDQEVCLALGLTYKPGISLIKTPEMFARTYGCKITIQ